MARISRREDLVQFFMEGQGSLMLGDKIGDLSREDRKIQREINRAMRDLEKQVQDIYRLYAPRRSGELRRRIISRAFFRANEVTVTVSSGARSRGFSYTPVTRFGHTAARIYPRRAKALVFPSSRSGRTIRRAWVRGYRPKTDWVTDADVLVSGAVDRAERRIGRGVQTVVLR